MGRLGKSDHCMIMTEVDTELKRTSTVEEKLIWGRADWSSMRNLLGQVRWGDILDQVTVNVAWNRILLEIDKATEVCVPKVKVKNTCRPKWLDRELLKMIRKKRQAWKAFKNYGTQENLDKYKKLEREEVKKVRNAKRRLEKEIATAREKTAGNLRNTLNLKQNQLFYRPATD